MARAILVIGPAWVGDMVIAQSLFRQLKADDPAVDIDVIAPPWTAPVATRMAEVRRVLPLAIAHGQLGLLRRLRLGRDLRGRYERVIVLPNSFKSALTALATGAAQRTGFLGEMRRGLLNDIRREPPGRPLRTVDRFVLLARPAGAPRPEPLPPRLMADAAHARATLKRLGAASVDGPVLALCPGAEYGPAKRWPARHFSALAQRYRKRGFRIWILGSSRDREAAEAIDVEGKEDFSGQTGLLEAIDLLAQATAVVSNDSGLMHVAAALGRPLAALYGSSDPTHTPPLDHRAVVVSRRLPCSPCFARTCPLGHLRCLEDLDADQVALALDEALAR